MLHVERLDTGQAEGARAAVQPRTSGRFARRAWTMVLTLAMSMGFVSLNAGSASALEFNDVISINLLRNWETGLCLYSHDVGSIRTVPCRQGDTNETWKIVYRGHVNNDLVYIQNMGTRRCLLDDHGRLSDYPCGSVTTNAYPIFEGIGSGWDKVQLKSDAGACLDSNRSGDAYINSCNSGGYQLWKSGF